MRIKKWIAAGLAALTPVLCIAGLYPLVPAFYAAAFMKWRSGLLYLGIFLGMQQFLSVMDLMKYLFILLVYSVVMQCYLWIYKRNNGVIAAGVMAATTILLNTSGTLFSTQESVEFFMGVCEGLLVFGFAWFFYYVLEMVDSYTAEEKSESFGVVNFSAQQLEAFSDAMGSLSRRFSGMSHGREWNRMEQLTLMETELTMRFCQSCGACAMPNVQVRTLLQAVVNKASREELMQQDRQTVCRQYPQMVEEALKVFERMELNEAWYRRLLENRVQIAEQFDAMTELLANWKEEIYPVEERYRKEKQLLASLLKKKGIPTSALGVYLDAKGHLRVQNQIGQENMDVGTVKQFQKAVERAFMLPMVVHRGNHYLLAFEQPHYYMLVGAASKTKSGSEVSGDNFGSYEGNNGKFYLYLSDGMGSGERASKESELVVELMEQFLEAGFCKEAAVRMMNSAMVIQGEEESYSTLDFAEVDLYEGTLELIKIGGAATFLKHGKKVECLNNATLPAGANRMLSLNTLRRRLRPGDFLVMVTDGMLEYLYVENPEELFASILAECRGGNAGALAKEMLDQVLVLTGQEARDDMTVIVAGFWENR